MLRYETSTGGTDLLAHIISKANSLNIGMIIFLLDGLVALIAYSTLGPESFLFSALTILIVGVIASNFMKIHYGRDNIFGRDTHSSKYY